MGKALGTPCVTNVWVQDGFKDTPADRLATRERLAESHASAPDRQPTRHPRAAGFYLPYCRAFCRVSNPLGITKSSVGLPSGS